MKKGKRIIAGVGAILLVVMYVATLIFALIDHPKTESLFIGSLICTGVVPVLLYSYILIYKVISNKEE